ncbi:MAG: UDP-N-acetylmuramoyl-tripeptide--D-alanyl-D-alanine ligase [Clostridia bacterium]|nr:UDP-N-acetylmuramoyl-tripeptide--D-alanyl-D-alanine ligase [Clostridia bacterium]
METITISEILTATGGKLLSGNTDQIINRISCDSREIGENCLFIPLKGERFNGNDFIEKALENGAAASLVSSDYNSKSINGALIEVEDTLKAMQNIAKYYLSKFDIPVIGVTGSVGKTTTKEMIAAALGKTMKVFKTEGNYNGQIGLPMTIFNLDSSYEVAILEMGVSKFGEMETLCDIANPDIGVITNIGMSHMENFKSMENTCKEKLKIVKKENAVLYLNGDSPILLESEKNIPQKVIYFGLNGDYPFKCQDVYSINGITKFTLITPEFREEISIPCLGIHNVYNALAAVAIALGMGIHLEDIKKGLLTFKNAAMRQQISEIAGITIIDDSYNASPDSMKSAVSVLKSIESGRKIVVMADMLELGENSANAHYEIGRYIAIEGINILITIGDESKNASEGAKSANQNTLVVHCNNNHEAYKCLESIIKENDRILIKGSRGTHTEEIVQKLKEYLKSK